MMVVRIVTLLLCVGLVSVAHAQFSSPFGGAKSGGDISLQVDMYNGDASIINRSVGNALLQIVAALGTKEQVSAIREKADSLNKTTDPKEVGAIVGTIVKDDNGKSLELLKSADAKEKMAKLSPQIQKSVARSIFNVGIAALKMPDMIEKGKGIVSSAGSNPMSIGKIAPVKNGMDLFIEALPKLPTIASVGLQLMRDVKVDPGNPTKDSKIENSPVSFPE